MRQGHILEKAGSITAALTGDMAMAGFGENLRRERELRGISLEEISESTKISVRLLEALENDQFSKLPGGIFTRSFIRSYANYVGLDADQVITEYHLSAPQKSEEDFSRLGTSGVNPRQKRRFSILPWIVAVILLGGGYAIFRYSHRSAEAPVTFGSPSANAQAGARAVARPQGAPPPVLASQSPRPPGSAGAAQAGDSTTAPAPAASTPAATSAGPSLGVPPLAAQSQHAGTSHFPTVAAAGTQPGFGPDGGAVLQKQGGSNPSSLSPSFLAAAEAQGELVLQVAASQPSWVAVDADGKTVFEQVLTPRDTRTLVAKNYFDVITGNARDTILTLNGVALKPLGDYGEVKKIHLTRADLTKPAPAATTTQ